MILDKYKDKLIKTLVLSKKLKKDSFKSKIINFLFDYQVNKYSDKCIVVTSKKVNNLLSSFTSLIIVIVFFTCFYFLKDNFIISIFISILMSFVSFLCFGLFLSMVLFV